MSFDEPDTIQRKPTLRGVLLAPALVMTGWAAILLWFACPWLFAEID